MREDEGYDEARKLLADRYGQPYKIATAYVDRIINGQPIRAEDGAALQKYSILLTSCSNTLREIGHLSRLENPDTLKKIVDRLPYTLRLKWREMADKVMQQEQRDANLKDITDFVESRSRVTNHPIFGKISGDSRFSNSTDRTKQVRRTAKSFPVQVNSKQSRGHLEVKTQPKCPSCEGNHWLSQCEDFKKLSVSDRYQLVRSKKLCSNCLVPGHFAQDCPKKSFCRITGCNKKHSSFLHPRETTMPTTDSSRVITSNPEPTANTTPVRNSYIQSNTFQTLNGSTVVGLSIVPVKVKAKGQDKKITTYAFLDSGSNTSFCTDDLLKKLNIKGERTNISLTTLQSTKESVNCSIVNLEVSDLSDSNVVELPNVFSSPSLPVSADTIGNQEDVNRWPHLKGIKIESIRAEIGLLIGSDAPHILQPREFRESKDGGPFATRLYLAGC
ncbi:uncharacterized protein [Montipora capricornis]|uniref:uncharacterized protein n=1 Tax=Montipora capricornis TaxID=246305 RepID=UPI0035F147EE